MFERKAKSLIFAAKERAIRTESVQDKIHKTQDCVKNVCIRSYSGPHFPAFGLNTERYSVSLPFQSSAGKYGPEQLRIPTPFTQCKRIVNQECQSKIKIDKTVNHLVTHYSKLIQREYNRRHDKVCHLKQHLESGMGK